MLVLETPRLRLRRWQAGDVAPFAAMNADPVVMEYFPATITPAQTAQAINQFEAYFEQHGYSFWAVEMKASGAFVGSIGLEPYLLAASEGQQPTYHVAIGWQLARAYWGQGLALEAANTVREYAKDQLKCNEIIAIMAHSNLRSIRICEGLGMVQDDSRPFIDAHFAPGHAFSRQVLYRLCLD